jgi:hypothetical protein
MYYGPLLACVLRKVSGEGRKGIQATTRMIAEVIRNGCNVLRLSVSMFLKSIFEDR